MNPNPPTPSALQQLRQFVCEDDTIRPWSSIEEVMEHLVTRIGRHRDDERWRAQLLQLLLAQRATDRAASPWKALITRENLDALMDEIQGPAGPGRVPRLLKSLSAPAILGLSAMTMAVGCNNLCPEAGGIPPGEQETYCELVDYINDADIGTGVRDDILDCLPDLSAAERTDMADLFATYDADQIADYLGAMALVTCQQSDDDDDDTGH